MSKLKAGKQRGTRNQKVVIVIENMSYTFDTRVRKISRTLARSGFQVQVICPRYPGDPRRRTMGKISVLYYPLPSFPNGLIGHILEYLYSFTAISLLVFITFITSRFNIIHICNPPDILFPVGVCCRMVGCKFIFDLHDLCPELWQVRYGKSRVMYKLMLATEKATVRLANHVLLASQTQLERILNRTGIRRKRASLVYSSPELDGFPPEKDPPRSKLSALVGYVGEMNPQDGVEMLLLAACYIHYQLGRTDVRFLCIGDGSAYIALQRMSERLGLTGVVDFSGRLIPRVAMERLADCSICILPDPKNAFTDSCAMAKAFEYMALSKPFVAFDLQETQNVCGDAAIYACGTSYKDIAMAVIRLLDDPELCRHLGKSGHRRITEVFAWPHSEKSLLRAYDHVCGGALTRAIQPDKTAYA